jgi:peptide/nickel transport system substrate-binding protein
VAAAKAELAKSSVPNGFSGDVIFSQAEPDLGRMAQSIAQDLDKIGIHLKVKQQSDAAYTDAVFFKHTAPASVVDFTTDSPDPISLPNYLANSVNTLAKGGYTNISEFTNPAADTALNQYLATPASDTTTRGKLLGDSLKILADNEPYVPVYNANYTAVVKKGIAFKEFNGMWWLRRWPDLVTSG